YGAATPLWCGYAIMVRLRHYGAATPLWCGYAIMVRLRHYGVVLIRRRHSPLKGMDWSTMQVARTRKEPPDKGGWNLFHTWGRAASIVIPAVHFGIMGGGQHAWYGWPDVPLLDKLVTDWVRATDQTQRKLLADEIQKVALGEVTYVPWGEWF